MKNDGKKPTTEPKPPPPRTPKKLTEPAPKPPGKPVREIRHG